MLGDVIPMKNKHITGHSALACVIGSMNIVRPLGEAGIACAVLAPPTSPALYSRYTVSRIDWADPAVEPERWLNNLEEFGRAQDVAPVLFFEEDQQLLLVSRSRERLERFFRLPLANPVLVEDLLDKSRFADLAEKLSLPVPATRYIEPYRERIPKLALRFPLILKEAVHHPDWRRSGFKSKAILLEDHRALEEVWAFLRRTEAGYLLQEFVPGSEREIESYHNYVDASGEIVAEFTGKKVRTFPKEFGYTTALEITEAEDVAELAREISRKLALRGVAKFDFKRAPDGRLHLLEVNPRFNLWHLPGALAGVNLPAIAYADLIGAPKPATTRPRPGIRWCDPLRDYKAIKAAGLPVTSWLFSVARCEAIANVSARDPMAFLTAAAIRTVRRVRRR